MSEWNSGVNAPKINPEALLKLARGTRVAELLPDMQEHVCKLEELALAKAFREIEAGELTPQRARDVLGQVYAGRQLLRKFEKTVKEAQALGETLKEDDDG